MTLLVAETPREYGRALRREQTDAERRLWLALGDRRLAGVKFRRQHPIGAWIVDFVCLERKLIVELDGGQHTEFLVRHGYRVLRFWNNEALANWPGVLQRIVEALGGRRPSPRPSPQRGEGRVRGRAESPPDG